MYGGSPANFIIPWEDRHGSKILKKRSQVGYFVGMQNNSPITSLNRSRLSWLVMPSEAMVCGAAVSLHSQNMGIVGKRGLF